MTAPALTERPYQRSALDAIIAAVQKGTNRQLLQMATGTGKTVTFARLLQVLDEPWLRQWGPGRGAAMLVIAHREELLDQAADKITRTMRGAMVTIEQGDRYASRYSDVVVASIQTLAASKFRRLTRLLDHHQFRVVVVDEAHHASANTYRGTLVRLGFLPPASVSTDTGNLEAASYDDIAEMEASLRGWDAVAPKDRLLLGVTATPNRSDSVGLGCVFQSLVFTYPLRQAIRDGWLVPLVPWVVETNTSLDEVGTTAGDFNQRQLAQAVNTPERTALALALWHDKAPGRPTITFTVDVAHAHAFAEAARAQNIRAIAISGETPKDDRRNYLKQYTDGQYDMLVNCMVLTEGTDLPRTSCILHAKPTKSATLLEQMTGRGLRLFEGKADCVSLDIVDITKRHSLQTVPVLFGLPPNLSVNGKDLETVSREYDELVERYPSLGDLTARVTLEQLHAKAKTFDLWTVRPLGDFATGRALTWFRVGTDDFHCTYPWGDGAETLVVSPDLVGNWSVSLTLRPAQGGALRQRTLASGVTSASDAAGVAEAFVKQERSGVERLRATGAAWRKKLATDKQLAVMKKFHIPTRANLTAGEASDLLDVAFANKRR